MVLIDDWVGVLLSSSSSLSTLGCRNPAGCTAALPEECGNGVVLGLACLEVDVGLEVEIAGDADVERESEVGMLSNVMFC